MSLTKPVLLLWLAGCSPTSTTDAAPSDTSDGGSPRADASDAALELDAGPRWRVPGLPNSQHDDLVSMCETFHTARCTALRDFHQGSVHFDECVTQGMAECVGSVLPRVAGAFREGRIVYDVAALDACLKDARENYLETDERIESLPVWRRLDRDIESCRRVFTGTVVNGDPCYPDAPEFLGLNECAQGVCSLDSKTCPSVCVPYLRIGEPCKYGERVPCEPGSECYTGRCDDEAEFFPALGEACEPDGVLCAQGLTCLPDESNGHTCAPPRRLGESCEEERNCVRGGCVARKCRLLEDGDACSADAACGDDLVCLALCGTCDGHCGLPGTSGDVCIRDTQCQEDLLCMPTWPYMHCKEGSVGSTCCSGGTDCSGGCREGLVCDLGQHCRAERDVGDACAVAEGSDGVTCLPHLYCSSAGRCERLTAVGDACTEKLECGFHAYCADGTCATRKRPGARCASSIECTDACVDGTCKSVCHDG